MKGIAEKKYIGMIKKTLPLVYKNRRLIIDDIRREVVGYVDKNTRCSYEDLVNEFGSPEEIVNEYTAETISSVEFNRLKKYYITVSVIIACITSVVVCVSAFVLLDRFNNYEEPVVGLCNDNTISEDEYITENSGNGSATGYFSFTLYETYGGATYEVGTSY